MLTPSKIKRLIAALVAVLALAGFYISAQDSTTTSKKTENTVKQVAEAPQDNTLYPVSKIVDGDTIDILVHGATRKLRLIGINTPEIVDPRRPVQCFGKQASEKTKSLLTGKSVKLETDPSQDNTDKYGRFLRYVYLEDGTNVNKLLIEQGFAYEYTYNSPYKYQADFKQAQKDAENAKRGLWADNVCPVK